MTGGNDLWFTDDHHGEMKATLGDLAMDLIGEVRKTHIV